MNIVYVSSEVVPFSKTGGLGDVAGALPAEIAGLGHTISVMTPYYRVVKKFDPKAKEIAEGVVPVGNGSVPWKLLQASGPKNGHKVYFIANDGYFDREGLYGTGKGDYEDSCSRFVFFSRACIAAAQALEKPVDIFHCHDWQSALIPAYLRILNAKNAFFADTATVFTIHNMAYQGLFWHWDYPLLNLPWPHYNWKEFEFHGKLNMLKGALVYSDMLTTVSPTYAREIQTAENGWGLDGVLKDRREDLVGIVNGIDSTWDPAKDQLLPATYTTRNFDGKRTCKTMLRKRMGLPDDSSVIIGMIGRLFEQKGFDLVAQGIEDLLKRNVQVVILGTGRDEYHRMLQRVQQSNPQKVAVAFAFDNALAHLIEAGSDLFLMPSRYEPCGLNQLYSLAYGTPPVVHSVGGLADTVMDTNPETLKANTATGFRFDQYSAQAMLACIDRALQIYANEPEIWRRIQYTGMSQDWSWRASAQRYVEVYGRAKAKVKKA